MDFQWDFKELLDFANNLGYSDEFETSMMTIAQEIARKLHDHLLVNTPVLTGNLRKMWSAGDNLYFTVENTPTGYYVTLINTARAESKDGFMYGIAVNDGHSTPTGGWVMGRFFVEKSIIQTCESNEVERIIMKQLQRWWDSI